MVGPSMPDCAHRCNDKRRCKHGCCKRNLPPLPEAAPPAPPPVPAGLTDMKDQVYFVLHQGMMHKYRAGNVEAFADAQNLLLNSDLPLLLKARCCMVLSTNDELENYVDYARTAVRLLDEDARDMVEPTAFPQVQFDEAKRLLREAEAQEAIDVAARSREWVLGP